MTMARFRHGSALSNFSWYRFRHGSALSNFSRYRFRHGSALSNFSWYRGIRADCEVGYRRPSAPNTGTLFPLPSCRLHRNDQEKRWCGLKKHPTTTCGLDLATTITYLGNNQNWMHYPAYRRQGLPVSTAWMESLVKEVNYRVKRTEMFWNDPRGLKPSSRCGLLPCVTPNA